MHCKEKCLKFFLEKTKLFTMERGEYESTENIVWPVYSRGNFGTINENTFNTMLDAADWQPLENEAHSDNLPYATHFGF